MNVPHIHESSHIRPSHPLPLPSSPPTQQKKATSFLNEIAPLATKLVSLGTATPKATQTIQRLGSSTTITEGFASTAMPAASEGASTAGILQGIMGAASLALSWGRSTPAAGAASGTAVGATIGTLFAPGIGTAIGAGIGAIAGGILGCIKTGKHKDQVARDQVRAFLQERGVLDSSYCIHLADGSLYNIGIDGGPKAEFGGHRPYEVDFNNPLTKYAVSWMNPLIDLLSQGNEKIKTDFVGYFANAAMSNATSLDDVRRNITAILQQFGVSDEALTQAIIQAANSGQISQETARAYLHGIQERADSTITGER